MIMGSKLSILKNLHLSRKSSTNDVSVKDSPSVSSSRSAEPIEDDETHSVSFSPNEIERPSFV